jgi:hypothetical protein
MTSSGLVIQTEPSVTEGVSQELRNKKEGGSTRHLQRRFDEQKPKGNANTSDTDGRNRILCETSSTSQRIEVDDSSWIAVVSMSAQPFRFTREQDLAPPSTQPGAVPVYPPRRRESDDCSFEEGIQKHAVVVKRRNAVGSRVINEEQEWNHVTSRRCRASNHAHMKKKTA